MLFVRVRWCYFSFFYDNEHFIESLKKGTKTGSLNLTGDLTEKHSSIQKYKVTGKGGKTTITHCQK